MGSTKVKGTEMERMVFVSGTSMVVRCLQLGRIRQSANRNRPQALRREEFAFILTVPIRKREKVHQIMALPVPGHGCPCLGKVWVQSRLLGEGIDKGL